MIFLKQKFLLFAIFEFFSARYRTQFLVIFGNLPGIAWKKKQPFLNCFRQLKKVVKSILSDILRLLVLVKIKIFFTFTVFEFTGSRRHIIITCKNGKTDC
jgi:hypothetical protein